MLLLNEKGNVYSFGTGKFGQLGLGPEIIECKKPSLIESLSDRVIVAIACGADHSLVVSERGELFTFG